MVLTLAHATRIAGPFACFRVDAPWRHYVIDALAALQQSMRGSVIIDTASQSQSMPLLSIGVICCK